MLMTVEELRKHITTDESDDLLATKLQVFELLIRAYTNNGFQQRSLRWTGDIVGGVFIGEALVPFAPNDTVQVSFSRYNDGLYTVESVHDLAFTVHQRTLKDESTVTVTRVEYPEDVKMGAVNLLKWELAHRDKVGVSSETISRHAVTYFDLTRDNAVLGFPSALMGFLAPYVKARFGQGVNIA